MNRPIFFSVVSLSKATFNTYLRCRSADSSKKWNYWVKILIYLTYILIDTDKMFSQKALTNYIFALSLREWPLIHVLKYLWSYQQLILAIFARLTGKYCILLLLIWISLNRFKTETPCLLGICVSFVNWLFISLLILKGGC